MYGAGEKAGCADHRGVPWNWCGLRRRFAQAGWNVGVNYCRSRQQALELVEELEKLGVRAAALQGDVSQSQQAAALVEEAQPGVWSSGCAGL